MPGGVSHLTSGLSPTGGGSSPEGRHSGFLNNNNSNNNNNNNNYSTINSRRSSFLSGGGINSMEHFASSFTRAQSFLAIEPPSELNRQRSFFDDAGSPVTASSFASRYRPTFDSEPQSDLYNEAIEEDEYSYNGSGYQSGDEEFGGDGGEPSARDPLLRYIQQRDESAYGSLKSTSTVTTGLGGIGRHARSRRVSIYTAEPLDGILLGESEAISTGTEQNPVIIRKVEDEDGHVMTVIAGQSTAPQTVFNSVNVLIGVGLLSLPLGFKYAGWVIGSVMMVVAATSTFYSARLLAKCLDTDNTLVTYADIAYAAFGSRARILVSMLFTLELMGAGVSLVVLFSDSLNALIPWISKLQFKFIGFALLTPPCFLPLRILSFSSILGIVATFGLVVIVLFDGFYKVDSPGSLIQPATTWLWPQKWSLMPMSIGIFMSPWGGHAVFPNIYRDMRHPQKYESCLVTTYQITFLVDMSMGVLGFLMFGEYVSDEVTKNILRGGGYPPSLSYLVTLLIAMIPLAKTPLNARPIVTTLDILFGLDRVSFLQKSANSFTAKLAKFSVRIAVVASFVGMAILFPDFDRVIAFFGSLLCVTICMILPLSFYLKIYAGRISRLETVLDYFLLAIFTLVAIVGTTWCMLPPDRIGQE